MYNYACYNNNMYLDSSALSYFECVRVLECLKSVEGEAQTLFGQYTAPRVKVSKSLTIYNYFPEKTTDCIL